MRAATLLLAAGTAALQDVVLYTDPIELFPGQVHNNPCKPIALPDDVVKKYAGKQVGVVKFQLDIVHVDGHGTDAETRVPLTHTYNHHTIQAMGTKDKIVKLYDQWNNGDPLGPTTLHKQWSLAEQGGKADDSQEGGVWMGPVGGAEYRNADRDLPSPYRAVVDSPESFTAVIHVINTKYDLQPNDYPRLFECPCTSHRVFNYTNGTIDGVKPLGFMCTPQLDLQHNECCNLKWYKGGYRCCENGAFVGENVNKSAPKDTVVGKFTLTLDDVGSDTREVFFHQIDVAGFNAEYSIPGKCDMGITKHKCLELAKIDPNLNCDECIHVASDELPFFTNLGKLDPYVKNNPFAEVELITARGHQHVGGLGMELINSKTGEILCSSKPNHGTGGADEPGNEKGYIVGIPPCVWGPPPLSPPPRMRAMDLVRIISRYNGTEQHHGVMGFWFTQMAIVKGW